MAKQNPDLEVLCPCTNGGDNCCVGNCLTQTAQALGISMTVGAGVGLSSTHPSALKPDWDQRFGKPLMTPSRAAPEYLSCIFTSSLTSAQPWLQSWSAQILSALSCVQVARACDYDCLAHMLDSCFPWVPLGHATFVVYRFFYLYELFLFCF